MLRTGYRVSRDARRIIIRRAGDQAGTELAEKSRDGVFRSRFFGRSRRKDGMWSFHFSTLLIPYSRGAIANVSKEFPLAPAIAPIHPSEVT
jgi:hypothetical protein